MAAKLGHKVCVIDSKSMVGGVCVNTGTIPSKTLREAVLYLTGMQLRDLYGASYRVKQEITISDLLARLQHAVELQQRVAHWRRLAIAASAIAACLVVGISGIRDQQREHLRLPDRERAFARRIDLDDG